MTYRQQILYRIAGITVGGKEISTAEEDSLLQAARSENITVSEALREAVLMRAGMNSASKQSIETEGFYLARNEIMQDQHGVSEGKESRSMRRAA